MSATNRSLIIPPEVLALPSDIVTWAARLVLSEIIDLYKPHHKVFAKDEHFSKRCVLSMRSVSDAVKQLADAGLIHRVVDQRKPESCRRTITPTVPGMVYPAPTATDASSLERGHIDRPIAESAIGQQKHTRSEALPIADSAIGQHTEAEDGLPLAESARGTANLPQNLREPTAESARALSQNLREPIAESASINTSLNTKGNNKERPIPTAASPTGVVAPSLAEDELAAEQKKIQDRFIKWQAWAKDHAPQVLKMKVPLTADKFNDLRSKWGVGLLQEVFSDMDNWAPLLTKNRNTWKTADTWCRKRKEHPLPQKGKSNMPITPTRTSDSMVAKMQEMETKDIE